MIGGAIDVEQMSFQLVRREENFEIRDYEQVVVAETVDDGNSGFRTLARYIGVFGTPENRVRGTDRDPTNPKKNCYDGTSDKPNNSNDGPGTQ